MREKLNDWWSNNKPDENLIYKNGLTEQCVFVRDKLMGNLFLCIATDYLKYKKFWDERCKILDDFMPDVIGTHYSKSVLLPVMEMDLSKIGLKIVLRNNFYDWCISVESENEVDCDFMGLITDQKGYFEGFPSDRIYKNYSENNKKNFSVVLNDKYEVYTFVYLLRNWTIKEYDIKMPIES